MEATYIASTSLTKMSILLFYRRMSDGAISSVYRYVGWASIAFVAAYMVTFTLTTFLGCRPLSAFWNEVNIKWVITHTEGVDYRCANEPAILLAASATSIVQDFLACGLPLPLFWKLQLPRRQKIALAAVFSVGFFLCITGFLRIYYIHKIFFLTYDVPWAAWDAWIWTVVEAHLAIICASAPALKIFLVRYLNVSSFTGSMPQSWRQRSYARKGYTGQSSIAHDTTSTANLDSIRKDVEMGKISVTQAVDVDSHSLTMVDDVRSTNGSLSDDHRLGSSPGPRSRISHSGSWLIIDPPVPRRGF
jgi:hypothetical protein